MSINRVIPPIALAAVLSLGLAWPVAAQSPSAKAAGTVITVTANPTRHITSGDVAAEFSVTAAVTVKSKPAKGKVVFYDGTTRLGGVALTDGRATLALAPDLSWGKHVIKGIYVPKKAGAKKYSDTSELYWQRAATAVYRIGGKVVTPSDTTAIKVKGKVKFTGKFTKADGSPVGGSATAVVREQKSDGVWSAIKTFKVKLKAGKGTFTWRNTLKKGTVGDVEWSLNGAWGVSDSVVFVSGKLPASDSGDSGGGSGDSSGATPSPTSSSTPINVPPPTRTCHYQCVQYGGGFDYSGRYTYGCIQQAYICD
jgi:hypothetical protein